MTTIARWLVIPLFFCVAATAQAEQVSTVVTGVVIARNGETPVPGVTASLVHPVLGRSWPSVTDPAGRFHFANVPVTMDPYYLELYWGRELVYRDRLAVSHPAPVDVGRIVP